MASTFSSDDQHPLIVWSIVSGLLLLLLLPVGSHTSLTGGLFLSGFTLHLLCQCICVFLSLRAILSFVAESRFLGAFILIAGLLLTAGLVLESLHPVVARDALIQHLAAPKWWIAADRIHHIRWYSFSSFPMLLQLAYTGFLAQNLEPATSIYHFSYLIILVALVVHAVGSRTGDARVALFSGFLAFSLPLCLRLASIPMVDLGLALFLLVSILMIFKIARRPVLSNILWAGAALGLALACKPNAVLAAVLLGLGVLVYWKHELGSSLSSAGTLVGVFFVAAVVYSPWMVRAAQQSGNPFYPFLNSYFQTAEYEATTETLSPIQHRMLIYGEEPIDFLTLPVRMLVDGEDGNPKKFDGVLSPLLLLALFPFFSSRRDPEKGLLLFFLVSYFVFSTTLIVPRARYLAPLIGPGVLLSGLGLQQLLGWFAGTFSTVLFLFLLCIQMALSGVYMRAMLDASDAPGFVSGAYTRETYLAKYLPSYQMISWVNQNLDSSTRVYLLLTGNQFYYYDVPVFSDGTFSTPKLIRWIQSSRDADALARELEVRNIGYILMHAPRALRVLDGLSSLEDRKRFNEFQLEFVELVHRAGQYVLLKIRSKGVATD